MYHFSACIFSLLFGTVGAFLFPLGGCFLCMTSSQNSPDTICSIITLFGDIRVYSLVPVHGRFCIARLHSPNEDAFRHSHFWVATFPPSFSQSFIGVLNARGQQTDLDDLSWRGTRPLGYQVNTGKTSTQRVAYHTAHVPHARCTCQRCCAGSLARCIKYFPLNTQLFSSVDVQTN